MSKSCQFSLPEFGSTQRFCDELCRRWGDVGQTWLPLCQMWHSITWPLRQRTALRLSGSPLLNGQYINSFVLFIFSFFFSFLLFYLTDNLVHRTVCWEHGLMWVLFHANTYNIFSWAVFPIPVLIYCHMLLQMLLWSLSCPENLLSLGWAEGGMKASGPPSAWLEHVPTALKHVSNKT